MLGKEAALALTVAALLAPAAAAQAAVDTIGSDLSGTPTTAIQRTEDTAMAQLTGGARPAVPGSGQVLSVEVKGCSAKTAAENPETAIFVQDLRDAGGGQEVISSSQRFHLPICGDPNAVSTFHPTDQCVTGGDLVGVVVGGQTPGYPQGTQYFVAKPSPGAGLGAFSKNGDTNIGSRFTLAPIADTELLVRARIGTGADSPSRCPGGTPSSGGGGGGGGGKGGGGKGGKVSAAVLSTPKGIAANVKTGRGGLFVGCGLGAADLCKVSLVAGTGRKGATRIGTIAGEVPGGQTAALELRLNQAGKRALRKKRRISAVLRGTLRGGAGSAKVTRTITVTRG
jgi:hypothetical protein